MKIHLLSDIHLESGPYALPVDLQCDVIVAAGDIGTGTEGVKWLKTFDKPVVYVLGNHEFWSNKDYPVDMLYTTNVIRAEAAGSNVHVLDNESIVINGVRFLGATLWTDFGQFNPCMIDEAAEVMGDYSYMFCPSFYANEKNATAFYELADNYLLSKGMRDSGFNAHLKHHFVDRGRFHPFVSYLLHQQSVQWINKQISPYGDKPVFDGKTVIVTHHHPSYESLRRSGVQEEWLSPGKQYRVASRSGHSQLYKAAAYASDVQLNNWHYQVDEFDKGRQPAMSVVNAWLCGHLHHHLDYLHDGMRVVSNARGRYSGPPTEKQVQAYALLGHPISQEVLEKSALQFKENPYKGNGTNFDANFIVDLEDGLTPVIQSEIANVMPELESLHDDISLFARHVMASDSTVAQAVRESIKTRAGQFETLLKKLQKTLETSLGGASLNIGAHKVQFYDRPYVGDPEYDPQFSRGFSGPKEEIASLLQGQKIVMQKLADLPAHLTRCQYHFQSMNVYDNDE